MKEYNFIIDCTGDIVIGDIIQFTEVIFYGSYRNSKYVGDRTIIAEVLKDSYGKLKQQHTFSLKILECKGLEPLEIGIRIRRKGRNIYRNKTMRILWKNEEDREIVLNEKHSRGNLARQDRYNRKLLKISNFL